MVHGDGHTYSTDDRYGPAIRVEIPLHYWAVLDVLWQVHREYVSRKYTKC